jgi:hypothetical protein
LLGPALVGGIFFARRNLRLGRGDRRNSNRLALFVLVLSALQWAFRWPQASFVNLLLFPYLAALIWVFYMAIEPFVRRRWPQALVSWTRLLSGEWRDPLVARDILIGCGFGVFVAFMWTCSWFLPSRFLAGPDAPVAAMDITSFMGSRFIISSLLQELFTLLFLGLATFCLLIIVKILLRNQIAAIAVCVAFMTIVMGPYLGFAASLIFGATWFFVLMRFGFVAAFLGQYASSIIVIFPITLDTSAWYCHYGYLVLAIFAAIVLYAFRTSLGGRPLIAAPQLDD